MRTIPGVLRTGLVAGALWGLALIILGVVTARGTGRNETSTEILPLLFPLAGRSPEAIGEGFLAARGSRRHDAIDVPAPRGTPVLAAADGPVRLADHPGAGLTVEQDESSGLYCLAYAHLESYPLGLRDGSLVTRGQVIGFVGTTGNAPPNVPHLHFAVYLRTGGGCWSGAAVDPVPLFARR